MATDFTSAESTAAGRGDSTRILVRFVRSLPLLEALIPWGMLLAVFATVGSQAMLWLTGEYVRCQALGGECRVRVPVVEIEVTLTLLVLVMVGGCAVLARITGWLCAEVGGQFAALPLYDQMIRGVGQVRTTFFDEYPSGKLINRIVRDFDTLRVMGPIRIGDSICAIVEIIVISAVIAIAHPVAGLAVVPVVAVFFYIQSYVAPMLQRCLTMRSVRMGELLHRETDVIEGARLFQLYEQEMPLLHRLEGAMRSFAQMHLLRTRIEAWGQFWCQAISAVYGLMAFLVVAYSTRAGMLSPVVAGVIVTAVFRLGGAFGWLTWSFGLLFESAGHARRIFEYVDLPNEVSQERSDAAKTLPTAVQSSPAPFLEFRDYAMSYRPDSPIILAGLNLVIAEGERVGLVGRTGAGKSSLMQSLFRMVHVRAGTILYRGNSLLDMPIDEARAIFGVVPQDPYLFEGTVRANLDRFGDYSDEALRRVLEIVQLDLDLERRIEEGGRNFSVGERQLLCLARVILLDRSVVIMDEPTSSVDSVTDARIQKVLREELRSRTVITIAHRLETLASMDRIVELADGRISREGPPSTMLSTITPEDIQ